MKPEDKNLIFKEAACHVGNARHAIERESEEVETKIDRNIDEIKHASPNDEKIIAELLAQMRSRQDELANLHGSPYFVRCDVKFDDSDKQSESIYFSKFSLPQENIFSWIAPASSIRFEQPGKFSYILPSKDKRTGELLRKDQFMIANGNILFMSSESLNHERTLIHQEFLSQRKTSFVLPEIVERMEKAQDTVIRAHQKGSLLIAGPAGSGKTTLALHRIAYLIRSPDTAEYFKDEEIIVFVQDSSTKAYFSNLLPQLGISNVIITTFDAWILNNLNLSGVTFAMRYGPNESARDRYEYNKYRALKDFTLVAKYNKSTYALLRTLYDNYLGSDELKLLAQQEKDRVLDRFDLTLLAMVFLAEKGKFIGSKTLYETQRNGKLKKKNIKDDLNYKLVLVDEVQNYLPEQLNILKGHIDQRNHAMLYVGDLAQQTSLCTMRDWKDAGESFDSGREVSLSKVYRTTKQVLKYIQSLGYSVNIPEGVKEGPAVKEEVCGTKQEELEYIKKVIENNPQALIGVLGKTQEYLNYFKSEFAEKANAHFLSINEAQGVEFDVVCVVGLNNDLFLMGQEHEGYNDALKKERSRVDRDLIYVALTRTMRELHLVGNTRLKNLLIN